MTKEELRELIYKQRNISSVRCRKTVKDLEGRIIYRRFKKYMVTWNKSGEKMQMFLEDELGGERFLCSLPVVKGNKFLEKHFTIKW